MVDSGEAFGFRWAMGQAMSPEIQKVLVVDDDDRVREIAAAYVEELGYPVATAHDGMEALEILQADRAVTVLLSDVEMPGIDGEALAKRARLLRPGLCVVLTSGGRRPQAKVAFVPKPFRCSDLVKVLPPRRCA